MVAIASPRFCSASPAITRKAVETIVKPLDTYAKREAAALAKLNKAEKELNALRSTLPAQIRRAFDAIPRVEPQRRTHGRTTPEERRAIYLFANCGIPVIEIAMKFRVSMPTVYLYAKCHWVMAE